MVFKLNSCDGRVAVGVVLGITPCESVEAGMCVGSADIGLAGVQGEVGIAGE